MKKILTHGIAGLYIAMAIYIIAMIPATPLAFVGYAIIFTPFYCYCITYESEGGRL